MEEIKVYLYGRVSQKDQTTIPQQIEALKERIKSLGNRKVIKIVEEKHSAKDIDNIFNPEDYLKLRPEFYKCYLDAKKGLYDELWCWKGDRFSRSDFNEILIKMFNACKVKVCVLMGSQEKLGRKVENIIDTQYIDDLKLRVELKQQGLLKEKRVLNRPPLGYTFNSKHQLIPDENKESVIKIFKLFSEGVHPKDICDKITIIKRKKEVPLSLTTCIRILKNKTYIGVYKFRKEEKQGTFETFISKENFDKADSLIKGRFGR